MKIYVRCANDVEDYRNCVIEKLDTGYSVYDSSGNELTSGLENIYEAKDYVDELNKEDFDFNKYLSQDVNTIKVLYRSFSDDQKKAFDEYMTYYLYADFLRYCSISLDEDNAIQQNVLFKKEPISINSIHNAYNQFLKVTKHKSFKFYKICVNTERTDMSEKYKIHFEHRYVQP